MMLYVRLAIPYRIVYLEVGGGWGLCKGTPKMEVVQEYSWQLGTAVVCGGAAVTLFYFFRKWIGGGVCGSQARLDGKTVIITGANTGIGWRQLWTWPREMPG